jgi:hypothetical protein
MLAAHGGVGGGHATMARAVLRLEGEWEGFDNITEQEATERILTHLVAKNAEVGAARTQR